MSNRVEKIIDDVFGEAPYTEKEKNIVIKAMNATLKEIAEINEEFIGRRIGEIDLDLVYKDEFKTKKRKMKP